MDLSKKKTNVDMLLVGRTGNGKSASGNTILQRMKVFQSSCKNHAESVTQETQYDYSEFEGMIIEVVDGPRVGDTNKDKKKGLKIVVEAMSKAVSAHTDGFNAILIVGRDGVLFTEEIVKSIKILKDIFGDAFIANHGILVMTCGDMFKIDEEESGETFEQWCQNQGGELKKLLTEVNNRVILFNNKEKDEKACNEQIRRLLDMIDGLARDGTRYTSEIFAKAKLSRNRLISESKRPLLQEHTIFEIGLITQQLDRIENLEPSEAMKLLESLKTRSETLLRDVLEQDKGTKSLSAAIKVAECLKRAVTYQFEQVKYVTDLQKKEEELERKFKKEHQRRQREKNSEIKRRKMRGKGRKKKKRENERKRKEGRKKNVGGVRKTKADKKNWTKFKMKRKNLRHSDVKKKGEKRDRRPKDVKLKDGKKRGDVEKKDVRSSGNDRMRKRDGKNKEKKKGYK